MTDAATGTEERGRIGLPPREERLIKAAASAHRDTKRLREQARYADRSLAQLEEAIHAFFGIQYRKVG